MPKQGDSTITVSVLVDALLKAANEAGLTTSDLIELLQSGFTTKEILLYAQTGISSRVN
jgi:hypothetical protein